MMSAGPVFWDRSPNGNGGDWLYAPCVWLAHTSKAAAPMVTPNAATPAADPRYEKIVLHMPAVPPPPPPVNPALSMLSSEMALPATFVVPLAARLASNPASAPSDADRLL